MNLNLDLEIIYVLRAALATVFGILIGLERQKNGRVAGIRTFATIALGTAVFTIMALQINGGVVNNNIIAAIVIGAGVLSAKMLVIEHGVEQDFSNIAAVWTTAAISVCLALGLYVLGGAAAALMLLIFWFKDLFNQN
jgi:putative Mg2+ transporter-C (MgtC) family protein